LLHRLTKYLEVRLITITYSLGIIEWAQVNGRDELSIADKVALDVEYLNRQSFWFDMKILWMTFLKVINRDGISH
jgi:O-antigen biosynthesis protein WbqP